jgi:uncharacterized protein (TIGR00369 family)
MKVAPNSTNSCFGCGGANERGMKLEFEADEAARRIRGNFRLGAEYQGGGGFLHGGIIALLLDEAMGKVCRFRDVRAVTAELTIEYLKPIKADQEISIEAFETEVKGRNHFHTGEIRNADGEVLARGRGRFVVPRQTA